MGVLHPCPAGVTKKFTDTMLDILVYLYESFRMAELAPDRDALEKRLFAAGFEETDINAALDWYANLTGSATHERLALVIVESPSKAKTLKKYLGAITRSSPATATCATWTPKTGSVDTENFAMKYEVIERNASTSTPSPRLVKKADEVLLATDPDREGEAISWHLSGDPQGAQAAQEADEARGVLRDHRARGEGGGAPIRARSRWNWSTPSRRGARWITWSASTCRRCCGRRSARDCPPAACKVRRCA
jgi:hypothetical protein